MEPSSDPSSPYYVHPGDGPSSVKVTPVLNGSNYHSWSRSMRRALGGDLVRISELQHEIYSLKQDSRSVTEFYSDLKLLWEELELYLPIPNCTCRQRCSCEAMRVARNNHTILYVIRFLTGLNENFAMVKSQILLMDPLPTLNKVFSMVIQHERQCGFASSDESKILINAARSKNFTSKPPTRVCTFCGKDNHIVDNCYKKYGLPPHLKNRVSANHATLDGGIDDSIAVHDPSPSSSTITQDQATQLIALLQNSFPNSTTASTSSNQVGSASFIGHPSVNQGLLGSKPAITPLDPSVKLHQDNGETYADISSYRRLIGKLLYLTNTRPDISFATQQLSQFLHKPTVTHYKAACRVVRYLKHSPGKGLMLPRNSEIQILGYSDADWAGCLDTRRSTSGYCFFLGMSLVSWKAKKQVTVSRSSSEADYRALSTATCELIWLLFLLRDLNTTCSKPPVLYCDSQSAMHIASNPVFHERTKHLEIDCHLVREKVQQGLLKLLPISTQEQLADFLTKALPSPKFNSFVSKLGMLDIYHSKLQEGC
ncbi:hypothetical protein TSUD_128950 [Trifolium subterraneum]|uniref:Retrotransposon Copia-like N-terminal domain-containing protein n=1 Tax=Trifolium subterraneum TaxID=3900 RepID=A0A2Z6PAH9_TRISU|nr:hypothetical protein TSUD_128950 [Trifolium subterraneum]